MNKFFITYGDEKFQDAKKKIIAEAKEIGEFDTIMPYGKEDLSKELLNSEIINVPRGGGLWSWKPDVIWKTMLVAAEGDIIVYCDSGCSLQKTKEWNNFWLLLERYDLIAQRLFQRTDHWTRKEILDFFKDNGTQWHKCYQYQATVVILVVTEFTRSLIKEWRDLMINHPELVMDVTADEKCLQHTSFWENRHDQAVFSALIYRCMQNSQTRGKVYTQWESIEDCSVFLKQAIRATRLRQGEIENSSLLRKRKIKRMIKDFILKPFYYSPLQWYYSHK